MQRSAVAAVAGYFGGQLVLAPASPGAALAELAGGTLIFTGFLLFPLSIGVAMLRQRLFDSDLLMRQTLIYTALIATLALLYEGGALAARSRWSRSCRRPPGKWAWWPRVRGWRPECGQSSP